MFELAVADRGEGGGDPLDDAIVRRNAAGSYAELERALSELCARYRVAHRGLLAAVDAGVSPLPPRLEAALEFVVARMPAEIRVPAGVVANARLLRDRRTRAHGRGSDPRAFAQRAKEMRGHARDGRSVQWIAAEYGVSVATVYAVVKERRS